VAADALLFSCGLPRFDWGGRQLDDDTAVRTRYIDSLREADRGDSNALYDFLQITGS
jgi:hypothetical protein